MTQLAIFATTDKFDVVTAVGTYAPNYDLDNIDVISWLEELDREQPFLLFRVLARTLAGVFLTNIKDPQALAERMYVFCPDIVDQGVETVERLAEVLEKERSLYFWWD